MARVERLSDDVTLYCGDCREVLPTLSSADALISDPPYGNSNEGGGDLQSALRLRDGLALRPIANDGAADMRDVVDAALTHAARLLPKDASACCCFCGGGGYAVFRMAG